MAWLDALFNRGPSGPAGPQGGNSFTSTIGNYVQPATGIAVTVPVASTAWMLPGMPVFVNGAGMYSVVTVASPTSVVLKSLGFAGSASVGSTVLAGAGVSPGGAGTTISIAWTPISSDGWQTIYTLSPGVAPSEVVNIVAAINMSRSGATGSAVWTRRFFGIQNVAGALADPAGNTSDADATTPIIGPALSGAQARIFLSGTSVLVQVQRPAGVAVLVGATIDYDRGVPAIAPSVTACSPSSLNINVASPQTITITLSSGGTGATAASIDGVSLGSVTPVSDTSVTGVLAAGTYSVGTGNVHVDSPYGPSDLVGGFTFSNVSAPTLTAVSSPFFSPPAGGLSVTLTGTGLSGATVTVGGTSATVTASSSTSITFTLPANAASGTAYGIQASNIAGGSNTLTGNSGGVYYIPASFTYFWVASQGFNASTGAWTDIVSGKVASIYGSTSKPTLTSSWLNGQPAITFNGTNQAIQATFSDILQPCSVVFVGDMTGAGATAGIAFDNAAPGGTACLLEYVASTTTASVYGGGAPVNKVASLASGTMVRCIFNGASSSISVNEGTAVTGSAGAGWLQTGLTIGASRLASPSNWWTGRMSIIGAVSGAINSTDSGIIHTMAQNFLGTP